MLKSRKYFDSLSGFIFVLLIGLEAHTSDGLEYRLATNVIPDSYDIWIRPYIQPEDGAKQFTFDGEVNITLHAETTNVQQITLHKDYIEITHAALYENETGKLISLFSSANWTFEQATDKLTFNLAQPLISQQSYVLQIFYVGQIRDGMAGVFRANYSNENGISKTIVLTQAQRIDARTIFPCFDEPAFKAQFRMRISRPKEFISVFNTELLSTSFDLNSTNRYLDTFDWSPKMSTYLVAFMVCEYTKILHSTSDLILLTRPEFSDFTTFSYEVAERTIKAYGEYTKQPYKSLGNSIFQKASSPKFPHNGMENWGLVLYKDAVLVHEPGYTDGWSDKQYTLTILVHETAHMWFGNSVTFAWWSYFWLNEAFARYYQYYMAHELYPEYQLDEQFVVRQVHLIFGTDSLNTTQPLTTPEELVQSPSQVASKFSSITYAKGASIVRMFRNLMGHQNFDLAIQQYLAEFHLKSVVPNDLFKHLKRHWPADQQVNLDTFFYEWTEQVGFPTLFVNISNDRKQVSVWQRRFLDKSDGSDENLKYTIPLTYTTDAENNFVNLQPKAYLNSSNSAHNIVFAKAPKWIIFNIQQSNYHRVFYTPEMLTAIKYALMEPQHSGIHVINRAQMLDDLFNFARVGMLDYEQVFNFAEYLKDETEFTAWYAAFNGLKRVAQRLTVKQQRNFGKFITDITAKVYQKLGFESPNDTVLDVYNRNDVIYWNCKYGTNGRSNCYAEAQRMLHKANATNEKPSIDFRATLLCSAVRFGDFSKYRIVNEWYAEETRSSEKELLLRAMGCTLHFCEYHFARILAGDFPQEHVQAALSPLYAENPENVSPVFQIITMRYQRLQILLGSWSALADVISDIANYFTTAEQLEDLNFFIEIHGSEFGSSAEKLQRASKTAENNLKWAEENLKNLNNYLEYRNGASIGSLALILLYLSGILSCWN